ncbi:hypothetical protein ACH495_02150 [Micromonospora sp. NPDC018662]|uniref:hypothetical protein n=1 Tax=Micromonospora sp. NPDC018662 TaxID=3364238 RepID=UPI0037B7DD31
MRRANWWWIVAIPVISVTLMALPAVLIVIVPWLWNPFAMCFERASFDEVVATLPPPPTEPGAFDSVDAPDKIGSCRISSSYGVEGGYIFYATDSPGLDDSGWGYFPNGPGDGLGNGEWEGPRFDRVDGPWYHWRASW